MIPFSRSLLCLALVASAAAQTPTDSGGDPLARWRGNTRVHPVAPGFDRHSIHSYFNTCPENPDGKLVLFYTSTAPDAQHGEIRVRDRITGEERLLASNINAEDAHRAACQQWASNGKRVVFHNERDGDWFVAAVDLDSGRERILARDRLVCWGRPDSDLVPIYGKHWNPGEHRDLELLDVGSGEIHTALTADAVKAAYPAWWAKNFGDRKASIFFPELSPDLKRVFFKMAAAGNGDPRSGRASTRQGLVCYDFDAKRFLLMREGWGHPAWHPDARHIVEVGYSIIDTDSGKTERLNGLPPMGSGHPSSSPDGKLIVTDLTMDRLGGKKTDWAIVVCEARGGEHVVLHRFDNSHGAKSWRVSHPHPVFSADGERIYFNVSSGPRTELYVAECAPAKSIHSN